VLKHIEHERFEFLTAVFEY